MKVIKKSDRAL